MGQNDTSSSAILKTRLNAKQRESVEYYLTRTTLLWNFLVHHTKEQLEAYISNCTKETEDVMSARITELEDLLADLKTPETEADLHKWAMEKLSEKWHAFIPRITELEIDIIYSRIDDFERAYKLARKDKVEGKTNQPTGLPQHKSANSSHSVHFTTHHFKMENGVLKVDPDWDSISDIHSPAFEIEAPGFNGFPIDEKTSLIITRRRQQAEISDLYGPSEEDNVIYTITLRQPPE